MICRIFFTNSSKSFPHKEEEKETGMDNSSIFIGVYTSYWLDLIYQCAIGDCLFDDETGFIHILGDVFLSLLPIILSLLQLVMVYAVCISFNIMLILILWCWSGCNCADICIWRWYIVAVWHWKLWSTNIYFR